jgi:hypothetical protein
VTAEPASLRATQPLLERRCRRSGVNVMKHLLSGTVFAAAMVIAAPIWAQTTPYGMQPAPYAQPAPSQPARHKARHAYRKHYKRYVGHMRMHHDRRGSAPNDNVANQLNAQELERVGSSPPGLAESHGGPYGQPSPSQAIPGEWHPTGGSHGGPYGQPTPTYGIPGAWQPSASSHPPNEMGQH